MIRPSVTPNSSKSALRIRRSALKWLGLVCAALVVLALLVVAAFWWSLRGSLAQLDGQAVLPGLQAGFSIERDRRGVPTIHANNRLDATRALGFLHAQDGD